jgi:hypothetical protein
MVSPSRLWNALTRPLRMAATPICRTTLLDTRITVRTEGSKSSGVAMGFGGHAGAEVRTER